MKKLITMLSALTITSSIAPLTVACGEEKELKGEAINIDSITADTITNRKSEYTTSDGKKIAADKLGTLDNSNIRSILEENLSIIISTKITALSESKIEDFQTGLGDYSNPEVKNMLIWYQLVRPYKLATSTEENTKSISPLDIRAENIGTTADDKNFTITITVNKWNDVKDLVKKELDVAKTQIDSQTEDSIREELKKGHKDITNEDLEKMLKNRMQYNKVGKEMDLDLIKAMHDLIKITGESKTISVDLNSRK